MYKVIRRASNQWYMDDSADNPDRPYGNNVILDTGEEHAHVEDAMVEMAGRNLLLCETDHDQWSIESDAMIEEELAAELAAGIDAEQVGDWLERHGEDRTLAD